MKHRTLMTAVAVSVLAGSGLASAQGTDTTPAPGQMAPPAASSPGATQNKMNESGTPAGRPSAQNPAPQTAPGMNRPADQKAQAPGMNRPAEQNAQAPGTNRSGAGAAQTNAEVNFTPEQRTRIRETVIRGPNAPRVSNVTFSLNVGTVVPRTVRFVDVPAVLVEVHPAWRGFKYFLVGDEIVIVEPRTLEIVAVIPA